MLPASLPSVPSRVPPRPVSKLLLMPPSVLTTVLILLTVSSPSAALCPEQCRCRPRAYDCSSAHFSMVPILLDPRIHVLRLGDNAIRSVADTLGFYESLRELDLSNNSLTTLGVGQLSLQKQLQRLQLANNRLSELRRGALEGLGRLGRLDLSGNQLTELEDGLFRPTTRLRWLNLSRNRIRMISQEAFLGLEELELLDLSGNELLHVPSDAFRYLDQLRTLSLADNQLTEIAFHAFFLLRSLRNLSLAGNGIGMIHAEAFAELHDLVVLDISVNHLTAFPAPSLAPLKLEELNAGGNRFRSLVPRHLDGLQLLRVVRLCGSDSLTSVSGHVFSNNRKLEEVHLCENPQLQWLPRTVVASMRRLRVLNIGGNGLGSLENITSLLQHVQVFNISGNPLVCNCSVRWLYELPRRVPNVSITSPVVCSGSSSRLLTSLSEQDLNCGWWKAAATATAASLFAAVCAALVAVLLVRHRRRRDRSRTSVLSGTLAAEKIRPRLVPVGSGKEANPGTVRGHNHFTLLSGDYVTDLDRVSGVNYVSGDEPECDADYARVYNGVYVSDYAVKTPSVVV